MKDKSLSRREREMMDIVYRLEAATASEIRDLMASPPSYSAVRATLRILVDKGHLKIRQDGPRYVYRPAVARNRAQKNALKRVISTFFDDSPEKAVAALLDMEDINLPEDEVARLRSMIEATERKES